MTGSPRRPRSTGPSVQLARPGLVGIEVVADELLGGTRPLVVRAGPVVLGSFLFGERAIVGGPGLPEAPDSLEEVHLAMFSHLISTNRE
jgi:hypothetical protein